MSRLEVLVLLREVFRECVISQTDSDDWSGCNTTYLVDQERLMVELEDRIEKEPPPEGGYKQ